MIKFIIGDKVRSPPSKRAYNKSMSMEQAKMFQNKELGEDLNALKNMYSNSM